MKNKMSLFNFYIDDELKQEVQNKLIDICGEQTKGQMSALIRVLLKQFVSTPREKIPQALIAAIDLEYTLTLIKNKRSKL